MKTLHLDLTFAYEENDGMSNLTGFNVDPHFRSEPWEETVMFAAAFDALMGPADADELELVFHDRGMGVVVYLDKLTDSIVTVYVEET